MLAETFSIYSDFHAQIFLDLLYIVIAPSVSTHKKRVVSVAVFFTFAITSI